MYNPQKMNFRLNPLGFNAQPAGSNPQEMVMNLVKQASPDQIKQVVQQAQSLGVPSHILEELQNLK